jgi:hypothetical protein
MALFMAGDAAVVVGSVASGAEVQIQASSPALTGEQAGVIEALLIYNTTILQLGPNAGSYGFRQGDTLRIQGSYLAPLGTPSGPVTGAGPPPSPPPTPNTGQVAGATSPPPPTNPGVTPTSTAPGTPTVTASSLESKIPGISQLLGLVQGAVVTWDKLPTWAKWLLVGLGVAAGAAIIVDTLPADLVAAAAAAAGLAAKLGISLPGSAGGGPPNVAIAKSWKANSVTFYLATNGVIWWQKRGIWKHRKPGHPVVLYPGKISLKQMEKGDKILDREAKKLRKILNRRAPKAPRRTRTQLLPYVPERRRLGPGERE